MKNGDNSSNELVPSSQFNPESTEEFNQLVSFFDNVLADNQNDNITKIVNAAGGAVPFVGAGFAQMINHFIPNQKTERVAKTLALTAAGIVTTGKNLEWVKNQLENHSVKLALLERGIESCAKTVEENHLIHISKVVVKGLTSERAEELQLVRILRLLEQLDESQLLTLFYYENCHRYHLSNLIEALGRRTIYPNHSDEEAIRSNDMFEIGQRELIGLGLLVEKDTFPQLAARQRLERFGSPRSSIRITSAGRRLLKEINFEYAEELVERVVKVTEVKLNRTPTFLGIDGCKAGWLAIWTNNNEFDYYVCDTLDRCRSTYPGAKKFLIDIPIGLTSKSNTRTIDKVMRKNLKGRASTVFTPPCREALSFGEYEEASTENFNVTGKYLSKQSFNIIPKIRQMDDFVTRTTDLEIIESHPEICFKFFNNGNVVLSKKTSTQGIKQRLNILETYNRHARKFYKKVCDETKRKDVQRDDILDALCLSICLEISAGDINFLSDDNNVDERNIPIRVGYFIPKLNPQ